LKIPLGRGSFLGPEGIIPSGGFSSATGFGPSGIPGSSGGFETSDFLETSGSLKILIGTSSVGGEVGLGTGGGGVDPGETEDSGKEVGLGEIGLAGAGEDPDKAGPEGA